MFKELFSFLVVFEKHVGFIGGIILSGKYIIKNSRGVACNAPTNSRL
jgi:hypothetical protein